MKNKILTALIFFCAVFSFAQSHISTQAHESAVNSLAVLSGITTDENTVFSAGQDGFIIKWTEDGLGEHYQITDLPIKMISRSPNGNDVAVYESDGASVNMVSIWNFRTLSRKCAFLFSDPVTSLNYSAKGTYVLCGTASVKGTYFLKTSSNTITSKKLKNLQALLLWLLQVTVKTLQPCILQQAPFFTTILKQMKRRQNFIQNHH